MRSSLALCSLAVFALSVSTASAQSTGNPVLGNIQSPYNPIQGAVKIAGTNWAAGAVAYGPVGTPLVLSGSNLGGGGSVQFVPYKNGVVDTSVTPAQATVTMWTSSMLILTVPSGALSGLVTVTVEGKTSNGLPFVVTAGAYSGSCPAGPTKSQLQIVTSALHDGAVGQAYSVTLQATGGTGAYSWSVATGSLPSGLSLNALTGTISGNPTSATGSNPTPLTIQVRDSSSPAQIDEAEMSMTIQPGAMSSGTIYSYSVSYDGASNVTSFQDKTWNNGPGIMGTWSMTAPGGGSGYDSLNRLMGANVTWPDGTQQYLCWSYDPFGNRGQQEISSAAFQTGSGGPNSCNAQPSASLQTDLSSYNNNNQASWTNSHGVSATPGYDAAGDMTSDGVNAYLHDAEGRVCAVQSTPVPGNTSIIGYLYDAGGNRVAKGTLSNCSSLSNCSCDPTSNGFQFIQNYVFGPSNEELSMLSGNSNWQQTNLFVGGKLIGTYDLETSPSSSAQIPWLHFHLEDPLGTRRMQVSGMLSNLGQPEIDFQSLPFGDQLAPFTDLNADPSVEAGLGATPLFFTGKERDSESGNDYFGARYYSSSTGRFLSPDWSATVEPVPYAKLDDPQSLNLYAYVRNNPLMAVDPDGHCTRSGDRVQNSQCAAEYAESNAEDPNFVGESAWQHDFIQSATEANGVGDDGAQQQVSQAGQDFIKGYEKLSLTVYDASKGKVKGGDWTIGYGHKTTKDAGPITLQQAEALFQGDVARMASHVSADLNVPVSQNQFDALVSLRFNAGANAITPPVADLNRTGHATMGDFTNHYITAGGVPMRGLELRRAAEWRIFSEGVYDASH